MKALKRYRDVNKWPRRCDAPKCRKQALMQCGLNKSGGLGSWCSEKHFKEFAK
jgi:hypothetical protein